MDEKKKAPALSLTLSAMFLAIGLALPFLTGQIPQIGKMLLPMHIPVLLCGLICGWQYGLGIGFILPFEICSVWDAGFVPDRNCNGL